MPIPTRNFYLVEADTLPDVGISNNGDYMNYRKSAMRDWKIKKKNSYSFYDQVNLN